MNPGQEELERIFLNANLTTYNATDLHEEYGLQVERV